MSQEFCDVCLFTSVPTEFAAAIRVFERLGQIKFHSDFTRLGRKVFVATMRNSAGEPLTLQVSCLPEMGGSSAMTHVLPIIEQYLPRFVGMSGICAGDPEKVTLGDLVIAVRAYEYGSGKVVVHDGKPRLLPDVKTFSPNDSIIGYAHHFTDWKKDLEKLRRPPSKRQQRDWLLSALTLPGRSYNDLDPQALSERMPQWRLIVSEMEHGDAPSLAKDGTLTGNALQRISSRWTPYKDRDEAEQFPMVMGSGPAVRSDNPFPSLREPERKLGALDMEGASVYQAVESIESLGKRALVVKGVSDYGDEDKDDAYRDYASEASAIYMFHFIQLYVNQQLMPRLLPLTVGPIAGNHPVEAGAALRVEPGCGIIGVDPVTLPDLAVFKDAGRPGCPQLVIVPAGSFWMGSGDDDPDADLEEKPPRQVTIKRFAIGRYPVTFAEFDSFCSDTNRERLNDEGWGRGQRPVINVSWNHAQAFATWLRNVTGKDYRLPTESEWEYACRAGTQTRFYCGNILTPRHANFNWTIGCTTAVGSYPANPWGLYDMLGNVWEHVQDPYHKTYDGAPADGTAWLSGGNLERRVVRGGSYSYTAKDNRSAVRCDHDVAIPDIQHGFRVARTL
jgi:formylglycine-generating enzyme required for sulfatase activity/nucleoside phosphorylase